MALMHAIHVGLNKQLPLVAAAFPSFFHITGSFLGFLGGRLQRTTYLLCLFVGVLVGAVGMSTAQESVFRSPGFKLANLVSLGCTTMYAMCAAINIAVTSKFQRRGSLKDYCALACLTSGGMFFTNRAMLSVSYSARIMCKSCKVVPVMLASAFFGNARLTVRDVLCGVVMTLGVTTFLAGDAKAIAKVKGSSVASDMAVGVSLLLVGLTCDACAVNFEERRFFRANPPTSAPEVAMYSSLIGTCITLAIVIAQGEVQAMGAFVVAEPLAVAKIFLAGAFGYISLACILLLVRDFGSTNCEVVKTMRKVLQTACSFFFFPRPIHANHVIGVVAVLLATLTLYTGKSRPSCAEKPEASAKAGAGDASIEVDFPS